MISFCMVNSYETTYKKVILNKEGVDKRIKKYINDILLQFTSISMYISYIFRRYYLVEPLH